MYKMYTLYGWFPQRRLMFPQDGAYIDKITLASFPVSWGFLWVKSVKWYTVDNKSMNPSLIGEKFCWFSREVFEIQISPIPIFVSSFQGFSDGPTQQLTLDKTWFWAIYLTDKKTFFLVRNFKYFLKGKSFIISQINGSKSCFI